MATICKTGKKELRSNPTFGSHVLVEGNTILNSGTRAELRELKMLNMLDKMTSRAANKYLCGLAKVREIEGGNPKNPYKALYVFKDGLQVYERSVDNGHGDWRSDDQDVVIDDEDDMSPDSAHIRAEGEV